MISGEEDFIVVKVEKGDVDSVEYTVPYETAVKWWKQTLPLREERDE